MILQTKDYLPRLLSAPMMTALLICFISLPMAAKELIAEESRTCEVIVVGFVGGMRSPRDLKQGVVQIGNRITNLNYAYLQVKIYRHWYWRRAYKAIYQNIDRDRDGSLSKEEIKHAPKVAIYGHSLGGWAVIKLSRKLERKGIPVELTVQIDSVGIGDEVIPSNVKAAVNFYQRSALILRGEKRIRAEDEKKTNIVDNYLIKDVGHESLARRAEISNFIIDQIMRLCVSSTMASNTSISQATR